jgi:hypothetical protein
MGYDLRHCEEHNGNAMAICACAQLYPCDPGDRQTLFGGSRGDLP